MMFLLMVGITPCGASYLLMPKIGAVGQSRLFASNRIYTSKGFITLSPVHFEDPTQLMKALDKLEHKKGGKHERKPRNLTSFIKIRPPYFCYSAVRFGVYDKHFAGSDS